MVFLTSARAAIGSRLAVRPVSSASSYTALSAFHTFPAGQSLKESDISEFPPLLPGSHWFSEC